MTYILGISAFYHDSAAALIHKGEIIGAVQEERFSRIKHDDSFPKRAIKFLLKENYLNLNDIEVIVFYEKPFLKFERLLETYIAFAPSGFKSFCASIPIWLREKLFQKKLIFDELQKIERNFKNQKKIKFSEHHLSHAASAFYPSPFEKAAILTLDGVGEWATSTISIGQGNTIEMKQEISFPHSLGLLYSAFTYYLGFKVNGGEYKVMGLAPYGEARYVKLILENLINVKEDGSFRLNMKYFDYATGLRMTNENFDKLFGQKRRVPDQDKLTNFHMDMAASIQSVIETVILKICKHIKLKYKIDNLCLAGGVALNCVANGKIIKENIFENIWIQPAAGDAGGSLGAALSYWYIQKNNIRKVSLEKDSMKGSLLGPAYSNEEVKKEFERLSVKYKSFDEEELIDETAKLLKKGKVIGWFQGKMEFGPRALGARSILADPRNETMQKKLNLKVKYRESFRPFAPAILREKIEDYFNLNIDSPYMLLVSTVSNKIKREMSEIEENLFGIEKLNVIRSNLPAITHVDYSARIQTVDGKYNKRFFKLLKKFDEITNCPVLINTSFNINNEPIVCNVEDAYNCYMGTDIDALVIEDCILLKDNN